MIPINARRAGKSHAAALYKEFMKSRGLEPCKFCSGEHWAVYHPHEHPCPRTPQSDARAESTK